MKMCGDKKDECAPVDAIKTLRWSGGIAKFVVNLCPRWRGMVSFMPWPLYPWGRIPLYH
jgi:hypothetical protein